MRIIKTEPDIINGNNVVIVTDSTGESHVIGCRSFAYAVELRTVIELGMRVANSAPETTAEDIVVNNLNSIAEKVLGTCPECYSKSINNKCTAQCGKERF